MKTGTDGLAELRKRVEAATGPDRMIDLLIGLTIDGWQIGDLIDGRFSPILGGTLVRDSSGNINVAVPGGMYPAPTESIDEALALVERKLPGWYWRVDRWKSTSDDWGYSAMLGEYLSHTVAGLAYQVGGDAVTAPLAILSALLSALNQRHAPTPETA